MMEKKVEVLKKALNNAGEIQNAMNVINSLADSEDDFYGNYSRIGRDKNNKVIIICSFYDSYFDVYRDVELPHSTSLFILKGRSLKGGLSTPMGRYHAWNYINKHGQKSMQERRTYVRRHKKGER